ncbi:actin filament-associated protein 1-like 1 isoform X2 [Haliotis asinina]|uniref:actin filament-associated protein 1-like 1 isoform X2 n=1 Tax=Haliotis asinina TaxID=109174 RepID=UPI0035324349
MASSADSPNTLRQLRAKAIWLELLPGIEDFLVKTLAGENLSSAAEEKRQYFVERLDILKLPPSIPPRPNRKSSSELIEEDEAPIEEEKDVIDTSEQPEDFAAYQREISRNLLSTVIPPTEVSDAESEQGVKVYDDIDIEEHLDRQDDEDKDEQDLYEIPVARLQLSEDSAGQQSGDRSSLATAASLDELAEEVADIPVPPPLPPRRDRTSSDLTSSGGGEDKPPDLPARPPPKIDVYDKSDKSEKSDKSDHTEYTLDGGDSTSYESYDEDNQYHDVELLNKLNIKLPKRPKKKSNKLKKKLSKSRSSSSWEINVPFKKLEDMALSGDLHYRGKLSWTRKLVALSNGNMACYKPDKETKPQLVVHLTGYEAALHEKENRKGYEIKLTHPNCDSHVFAVDFKEWAQLWVDHINIMAKGLPPPTPYQHLARTNFTQQSEHGSKRNNKYHRNRKMNLWDDSTSDGRSKTLDSSVSQGAVNLNMTTTLARWDWKTLFYNWTFPIDHFIMGLRRPDLNASNSNLSMSSDGFGAEDGKAKMRGNKVMRMGSFAYRATQFFESLGKKSGKRKLAGLSVPLDNDLSTSGIAEERSLSSESAPANLSSLSDSCTPVFDDPVSPEVAMDVPNNTKHQGYLNIFSSFNRRRWGKRWCLVRENMFECYRNEKSKQFELNLLLKNCVFRRAVTETSSEYALMLLEDGKEKITVEPLSKDEMGPWVHVLMAETATDHIPEGLDEYFNDDIHSNNSFSDLLGYSVIKSWEHGGDKSPSSSKMMVVSQKDIPEEENEEEKRFDTSASSPLLETDKVVENGDVYTEVQKKGKNSVSELSAESPEEYDERKHTTDSGFYSVKGSNSDSESDSGCVIRSEEEAQSLSSPTQEDSKELVSAQSPPSKKKTGDVGSGLHIRFCLDSENNNVKDSGEYDAIEVKDNNNSLQCFVNTIPEEASSHSESDPSMKEELECTKSVVNGSDSIEISKCEMLNSSSDAETVKSNTASMISLSDKLEYNATAVSDSDEAEVIAGETQEDNHSEAKTEQSGNGLEETAVDCHGNDNTSSSFHDNSEDVQLTTPEISDTKPSSSAVDFDKDIQQRIGRLREKLVQIKRKRDLWEDDLTFGEGEGQVQLLSCRQVPHD